MFSLKSLPEDWIDDEWLTLDWKFEQVSGTFACFYSILLESLLVSFSSFLSLR